MEQNIKDDVDTKESKWEIAIWKVLEKNPGSVITYSLWNTGLVEAVVDDR